MMYSYGSNSFFFFLVEISVEIESESKFMAGRYRLPRSLGLQSTVEEQSKSQDTVEHTQRNPFGML